MSCFFCFLFFFSFFKIKYKDKLILIQFPILKKLCVYQFWPSELIVFREKLRILKKVYSKVTQKISSLILTYYLDLNT